MKTPKIVTEWLVWFRSPPMWPKYALIGLVVAGWALLAVLA